MADIGYVDIVHTETGMTSSVLESAVPGWETAGWTRTDNGSEESGQPELLDLLDPDAEDDLDDADEE